jgi:ATP phosphoribosyltransferase
MIYMLKIAIPNKGRLSDGSRNILSRIGLQIGLDERQLYANVGEKYEVLLVRAQDIPEFVCQGAVDIGITGLDVVTEKEQDIDILLKLNFGSCRVVIAVPDGSRIKSTADVTDGSVVATSYPTLARRYFQKLGLKPRIVVVTGATETAPRLGVSDLIVDVSSTGSTLRTNHLKPIGTILESTAIVVANRKSLETNKMKISELVAAMGSVISASKKRYLMANVPVKALPEVKALLPGISGPTILNLMDNREMVAIHAVANDDEINGVISMLKSLGATGILVLPIDRLVI